MKTRQGELLTLETFNSLTVVSWTDMVGRAEARVASSGCGNYVRVNRVDGHWERDAYFISMEGGAGLYTSAVAGFWGSWCGSELFESYIDAKM